MGSETHMIHISIRISFTIVWSRKTFPYYTNRKIRYLHSEESNIYISVKLTLFIKLNCCSWECWPLTLHVWLHPLLLSPPANALCTHSYLLCLLVPFTPTCILLASFHACPTLFYLVILSLYILCYELDQPAHYHPHLDPFLINFFLQSLQLMLFLHYLYQVLPSY